MSEPSGYQVSSNAAALYERYAVPYMMAPWALELVDLAALQAGEHVLDLACGTGLLARFAAPRVGATGKVTGMDFTAEQLQRWLAEAGLREVRIRPSVKTIRLPAFETFVLHHLSASPVAGAIAALSEPERAALAKQIHTALHAFADGDGVAVPDEVNIAIARK